MVRRNLHIFFFLNVMMLLGAPLSLIQAKNFVIVIDPGHGGHDPGAIGQYSQEKNINLKVALSVGNLIEKNCSDVRVIYTRKTDVFIPLGRRAEIANEAKADLFLSIHTNSMANSKTSVGSSTWTLGLAKSEANLDVAKQENNVILYESDYKTRYAGFDPNSSESYIIFEFMQDKYMKESVHFASLIQNQFRASQRPDDGVHQAGFLVLKASAMPSVLVELGFISTPCEEAYLNSDEGVSTLSQDIFRAFMLFKREKELRLKGFSSTIVPSSIKKGYTKKVANNNVEEGEKQEVVAETTTDLLNHGKVENEVGSQTVAHDTVSNGFVFKLQLAASHTKLADNDIQMKDIPDVEVVEEDGFYKYLCAASTDYNKVYRRKKDLESHFPGAFIVAYRNGNKVDIVKAIRQFKNDRHKRKLLK